MPIILDVVAVLLFLFFLWRGKKRGFIKTVAGILALILAFWGTGILVDAVAPTVSENYVTPWVEDFLSPKVEEQNPETPTEFEELLIGAGVPETMAEDLITARPISELLSSASRGLANAATEAVLYLIFFIVLLILLKLIFKVIDKIFDLPVLNFANSTLGLICGGILGFLFIYLGSVILLKVGVLDSTVLGDTYVLRAILDFNLFKL